MDFINENDLQLSGAVNIEQKRAIADAIGKIQIAKACPRNEAQAIANILAICNNFDFADKAKYAVKFSSTVSTGLSIRAAQEFARLWGNIDYGCKVLNQREESTEYMVFAWDVENNIRSEEIFLATHYAPRKNQTGQTTMQLQKDTALIPLLKAQTSKHLRECILGVLPQIIRINAINQITNTISKGMPSIEKTISAFSEINVSQKQIFSYLGVSDLSQITTDNILTLRSIYRTIKDGEESIDYFFAPNKNKIELSAPPPIS